MFIFRKIIVIDDSLKKELWNPHLQFYKVKDVEKPKGYGFDEYHRYEYRETSWSGHGFRKAELITLKIPCRFKFNDYPFDKHQCNLTFFELRYFDKIPIEIKNIHYEDQEIIDRYNYIVINVPKSPFRILVSIGKHEAKEWSFSGVITINLERDSLDLLLGSFYIPTGIFAALSIGSYIINPEIVSVNIISIICQYISYLISLGSWKNGLIDYN